MFPDNLPYVIAMTEFAAGAGGQLGRMFGGFLYDFGGFGCPFLVIAVTQSAFGAIGFFFRERETDTSIDLSNGKAAKTSKLPWRVLLKPRVCLGAMSVFVMYF